MQVRLSSRWRRLGLGALLLALPVLLAWQMAVKRAHLPLTRRVYSGGVTSLRFAPDGELLSAGWDTVDKTRAQVIVRRLDAGSLQVVSHLRSHKLSGATQISQASLLPDGKTLAQISYDLPRDTPSSSPPQSYPHRYELRDVQWNRVLWKQTRGGNTSGALSVAPNSVNLAFAWPNGSVFLLHQQAGNWRATTLPPSKSDREADRQNIAFSPEGQQLITCSDSGKLRFWNATTGKLLRTLAAPPKRSPDDWQHYNRIQLAPNGRTMAACTQSPFVHDWDEMIVRDLKTNRVRNLEVITPAGIFVTQLAFSPDSSLLAGGLSFASGATTPDGVVLWNIRTGKIVRTLRLPKGTYSYEGVTALTWSADGRMLACGYDKGYITRWYINDRQTR